MPRRPSVKVNDLRPGMIVPAHVHQCPNCDDLFLGSSDATFCSNACRMAKKREVEKIV